MWPGGWWPFCGCARWWPFWKPNYRGWPFCVKCPVAILGLFYLEPLVPSTWCSGVCIEGIIAPRKNGGKGKGKQPAPERTTTTTPVSLDEEWEDPVNMAIIQRLEVLVKKRGDPAFQPIVTAGSKRTRHSANKSFQAQVLADLAAFEDDGCETSEAGMAAQEPEKDVVEGHGADTHKEETQDGGL